LDELSLADHEISARKPRLQAVDVELDVVRDRVSGGQILGLDLPRATWAVEFEDSNPVLVRCKRILAVDYGIVDLFRHSLCNQQSGFVVVAWADQLGPAIVAAPFFVVEIEIEIFGKPDLLVHLSLPALECRSAALHARVAVVVDREPPSRRERT